jgi:uncharacterized repeat protein (TIGR03847 family)
MARIDIDFDPTSHITVDALGKPGQRVFYLQGRSNDQLISLIAEKIQIQTLSIGLDQFLEEIDKKYEDLSEASDEYDEEKMHILPPIDPLFRIGELGLGYDADRDLLVLVAREILGEGQEQEDVSVVRFWCTRSQLLAMCRWSQELANRGRPICPQCGEAMEPEGHFCPKKNGHKH